MTEFKSPRMKLKALTKTVEAVTIPFGTSSHSLNADNLFPLLVWVVIFANPENFKANIKFIFDWCEYEKLMGKDGYVLTTFMAICEFLENVNGSALVKGELKLVKNRKRSYENFSENKVNIKAS